MRIKNLARIIGMLLTLMVAATAIGQAATPPTRLLYLRNDGTDCGAASHPFLATKKGTADQGCGYVGGGPFGEIFATEGTDTSKTYVTEFALEHLVDASRDVAGQITVTPYINAGAAGSGAGQIIVEIAASGLDATGELVDLGATSKEVTATPNASKQVIPFTLDVADAVNGASLTELSLKVNVRGIHVAHGFTQLNGESHVSFPYTEPVVVPTATPAP